MSYFSAIAAELALEPDSESVVVADSDGSESFESAVAKAASIHPTWVVEIPGVAARLEEIAKREGVSVFVVDELPGHVFATNGPLADGRSRVIVQGGQIGSVVAKAVAPEPESDRQEHRVNKLIKTAEERFVLGVVLVPEVPDSQGDIYSHEEVRKAAHGFMASSGALGKQHREIVTGRLKILESYLAPQDFSIGDEQVTQGTWLMGIRVVDDELWTGVKEGSFTGFSIGGSGVRRPEIV